MSDANKAAMGQFFERVYNQGDIAFLENSPRQSSSTMTGATQPTIERA
jgi:hypothetical protein